MTRDSGTSGQKIMSDVTDSSNRLAPGKDTDIPFGFDRLSSRILIALVIIAIVFQLGVVGANYIMPTLISISTIGDLAARERAARLLGGDEFAEYIKFLRERIPEDSRVIIPPRPPIRAYTHVGIMQYFLFPREIHNCGVDEVEACVERARESQFYILAIQDFPPKALARQQTVYIPFGDALGVFAPEPISH